MSLLVIARALHVLAVVVWIGGVAMVTTVVLPAVRSGDFGLDRLRAFKVIERRFVWIARSSVIVVGVTGLYMVVVRDLWSRFRMAEFWWMHAMVFVWLLFALILFVVEPLFVHRRFQFWAAHDPERAFASLHRTHWILLTLGIVAILGAVAGSQGWSFW